MIFLTVGSELPFDRLVRAVDDWAGRHGDTEIFGQLCEPGETDHRPKNFEWTARLDPPEFRRRVAEASHLVGHAGMGTIIDALTQCKPLLMMPRRAHLRETRNDHQVATVERFGTRPGLHVAMDLDEVDAGMTRLLADTTVLAPLAPHAEDRLIAFLHGAIQGPGPSC